PGPGARGDGRPGEAAVQQQPRLGRARGRTADARAARAGLVLRQVTFAPSPAERSSWLASTVIRRCGPATSRIDGWRQARRAPAERSERCLTRHCEKQPWRAAGTAARMVYGSWDRLHAMSDFVRSRRGEAARDGDAYLSIG